MTIFDLEMMSLHRSTNPSTEVLVGLIARWAGAWKPSTQKPVRISSASPGAQKPPDPTAALRKAFRGTNVTGLGENFIGI
jgi:hypothetical protein